MLCYQTAIPWNSQPACENFHVAFGFHLTVVFMEIICKRMEMVDWRALF